MKSNHQKGFSIDFLEVIFLQKLKKVRQPYVDAQKVARLWGAFLVPKPPQFLPQERPEIR